MVEQKTNKLRLNEARSAQDGGQKADEGSINVFPLVLSDFVLVLFGATTLQGGVWGNNGDRGAIH